MLKKFIIMAAVSACAAFGNFMINPNAPRIGLLEDEIEATQIQSLGKNLLAVDARSPAEFEKGHVEGAVNLSEASFDSQLGGFLDAWTPGMAVLVYCSSSGCNSSRHIADRLRNECGIENVYILKDDWTKWKR